VVDAVLPPLEDVTPPVLPAWPPLPSEVNALPLHAVTVLSVDARDQDHQRKLAIESPLQAEAERALRAP
jgi:hypothetical protein